MRKTILYNFCRGTKCSQINRLMFDHKLLRRGSHNVKGLAPCCTKMAHCASADDLQLCIHFVRFVCIKIYDPKWEATYKMFKCTNSNIMYCIMLHTYCNHYHSKRVHRSPLLLFILHVKNKSKQLNMNATSHLW
jgi:hypothetical protein